AVQWLVGRGRATVLELGAGTGKLTAQLLRQGHDVVATEPAPAMLAQLLRHTSASWVLRSAAERIPLADRSVDVVVAGQAFHWFDPEQALPEIARVLRPGGVVGLLWNLRDESVPWVRRLSEVIGTERLDTDPAPLLAGTGLFAAVEAERFRHWQQVFRDTLLELVASRSYVASRPEEERAALAAQVGELYDSYGRGPDGMLLPYLTHCYRARRTAAPPPGRDGAPGPPPPVDDDLLIDFS
ncbi:MAG: methyltransferase domain-containing protein, partial [Actinomycetota bacterium]|nr:methyltransferase domain-containing protein [Actinomycetota bacterium]